MSGQNPRETDPVAMARRINRTWIVRGGLDTTTSAYLDVLAERDPDLLRDVCSKAVRAARRASAHCRDPKPDFYAALFSQATEEERGRFLANYRWTRERSRMGKSGTER